MNANPQGIYVDENGEKSSIEVSLSTCPVMPTTVMATTDNPKECAFYSEAENAVVESVNLSFNDGNCGEAQKVTVIGVDDAVDDGNGYCKVLLTASSEDTNVNTSYHGMTNTVDVINEDNDTAKLVFSVPNPINIKETGDKGTFTVTLVTQPTSNVTVALNAVNADTTDKETHLKLDIDSLTFAPNNYLIPQTVTYTSKRDYVDMGDASVKLIGTASSSDANYNNSTQLAMVKVQNVDKHGVDIKTSGTYLYESKPTQAQTVTVKLASKPTHDVEVKLTRKNDRIKVAAANNSSQAKNTVTQIIKPNEWDTGKIFYVFPVSDTIANSNNVDKLTITTDSDDYDYFGYVQNSSDFTVVDDDTITNGKLNVSCTGTAGCTTQQGFANCTFSLDSSNRPADKSVVEVSCESVKLMVLVDDAYLIPLYNYKVTNVRAGGGRCGAAMEGDRFGTATITCTATTPSGFKATGSTSLEYSYHHLEMP